MVGMAMALKRAGLGACCDEGMPVSARLRWDFSLVKFGLRFVGYASHWCWLDVEFTEHAKLAPGS